MIVDARIFSLLGALVCVAGCHSLPELFGEGASGNAAEAGPVQDAAPATGAGSPSKTSVACDRLLAENRNTEAQAMALEPTCPRRESIVDGLTACHDTPSGISGLRFAFMTIVSASARDHRCDLQARLELVHVDRAGKMASTAIGPAQKVDALGGAMINFTTVNGWRWASGEPLFFDFDDDGEPEVFVSGVDPTARAEFFHGYEWHEAWTLRGGAWKKYPPLASMHFSAIEDVDHDGRPDVRTRDPYDAFLARSGIAGSADRILKPLFVLHSLPKGSFSASDAVAKKAASDACAAARPLPFTRAGNTLDQGDAIAIACARMHGQSANDVLQKLTSTCRAFVDDTFDDATDHCPAWAKQIATTTPLVTLP